MNAALERLQAMQPFPKAALFPLLRLARPDTLNNSAYRDLVRHAVGAHATETMAAYRTGDARLRAGVLFALAMATPGQDRLRLIVQGLDESDPFVRLSALRAIQANRHFYLDADVADVAQNCATFGRAADSILAMLQTKDLSLRDEAWTAARLPVCAYEGRVPLLLQLAAASHTNPQSALLVLHRLLWEDHVGSERGRDPTPPLSPTLKPHLDGIAEVLGSYLRHSEAKVRELAAYSFAGIGPEAAAFARNLRALRADKVEAVRDAALLAILYVKPDLEATRAAVHRNRVPPKGESPYVRIVGRGLWEVLPRLANRELALQVLLTELQSRSSAERMAVALEIADLGSSVLSRCAGTVQARVWYAGDIAFYRRANAAVENLMVDHSALGVLMNHLSKREAIGPLAFRLLARYSGPPVKGHVSLLAALPVETAGAIASDDFVGPDCKGLPEGSAVQAAFQVDETDPALLLRGLRVVSAHPEDRATILVKLRRGDRETLTLLHILAHQGTGAAWAGAEIRLLIAEGWTGATARDSPSLRELRAAAQVALEAMK